MIRSWVFVMMMVQAVFAFNVTNVEEHWSQFQSFMHRFDKNYKTIGELKERFEIYKDNMIYAFEENQKGHTYTLGENHYSDMTLDEFSEFHGFKLQGRPFGSKCESFKSTSSDSPASYDWRQHNAVTSVKDQGQCGSCWSFSATGAMEGAWAISKGKLESLSEQQLVDCSKSYGNHGCYGGLMDGAFEYVIAEGSCSEESYPYTAKGGTCESCNAVVTLSSCVDVTPNNQVHLKEAVANGPVSIAIEADTKTFQMYKSGVITSDACGQNLDHGVLIVGYGEESGQEYWLVKNSWGTSWGDNGYVKIARSDSTNDKGVCGIAMQPSYPVV